MKAVILAGGLGTRLSEETGLRPKPMVEIGGKPILWHLLKLYSCQGINDFIICSGYKGYMIKEYFANYGLHMSDVTINMQDERIDVHRRRTEPWKITLVDTGEHSMTGGRILRIREYVENEDAFCCTYGDGISDIDIASSIKFHKDHGKKATVTATYPPSRFGAILTDSNDTVTSFMEKPRGDTPKINGGFFVLNPDVFEYIDDDFTIWEEQPMKRLVDDKQLMAFQHDGFWQPMDTINDTKVLNDLWNSGNAPWKKWI